MGLNVTILMSKYVGEGELSLTEGFFRIQQGFLLFVLCISQQEAWIKEHWASTHDGIQIFSREMSIDW